MWWFVEFFLKALALIVIGELLRPKPKIENPKPNALGDFSFPTAQEGRVIPVAWGTVKISGPNVTWYGDLKHEAITEKQKTGLFSSKRVTLGYKYHLGIQHALCHGYIDEFVSLLMDGRTVALTAMSVGADVISFQMNSPTLFGKEKEQGGVKGPVKIYRGSFTQPPNEYLRLQLGEPALTAYRPVCYAVMEGCYLGNSGNLVPPEWIIRRTPNPLGLAAGKFNLNGDANPANMLFEIMTDRTWGMGIPSSLIDTSSFVEVGNTLANENYGLSMLVDNEQGGNELLAEILRHIDGVIYSDFETGMFKIALVRDDYDIETLPVFDQTNILSGSLEFARSSWEDTQNTVKIKYLDRSQNYTERVIQQQDLANISVRGGQIEAEEYDFYGVSKAELANYIAARVLRTVSSPLAKVNFDANRTAAKLRPGSVIKLRWPELGIENIVLRITEIEGGTIDDPAIRIAAVEDIFAVAAIAYTTPSPSGWVSPNKPPTPLSVQALVEAPYFIVGGEDRYVLTMGARSGGQEVGYKVYSDPAGGTAFVETNDVIDMTPTATLVAGYGASTFALDNVGFVVENPVGLVAASITATQRASGENLLLIDDEVMAWTSLTDNGDGTWTVGGVVQGVLDTLPAFHTAGARAYFLTEGFGSTSEDPYASNLSVNVKLLPYTFRTQLPIADATAMLLTLVHRANKPYPAANVKVNGDQWYGPPVIEGAGDQLVLTWSHRDRIQQISGSAVLQQDAADIGPEAGVTYTVKLYDENDVLRRTITGLTDTTYTWGDEIADSALLYAPGDPFIANVVTLLHFDGPNNSTSFPNLRPRVWSPAGDAKISTAQSKSSGSSAYFDGVGDFLSTPDHADFDFGSGDFTIEAWVRIEGTISAAHALVSKRVSLPEGWALGIQNTGSVWWRAKIGGVYSDTQIATAAGLIVGDTWTHIALSRNGDAWRLFVNGTLSGSLTNAGALANYPTTPVIGKATSTTTEWSLKGWLDEFRITKGVGRYTADFTPPDVLPGSFRLNESGRIELITLRDGVQALQNYDFTWTRPDVFERRVTEDGELRETEDGEIRILE